MNEDQNKRIILGLLNILCNTSYDDFTKIIDNDINFCFQCIKDGVKMEHIISKEYFMEAIEITNEELFGVARTKVDVVKEDNESKGV